MAMGSKYTQAEPNMKAIGKTISRMVMEPKSGLMERSTKEPNTMEKSTGRGLYNLQMDPSMLEISLIMKLVDMANNSGLMVKYTWETGRIIK